MSEDEVLSFAGDSKHVRFKFTSWNFVAKKCSTPRGASIELRYRFEFAPDAAFAAR
jgi:hypothetical protein